MELELTPLLERFFVFAKLIDEKKHKTISNFFFFFFNYLSLSKCFRTIYSLNNLCFCGISTNSMNYTKNYNRYFS